MCGGKRINATPPNRFNATLIKADTVPMGCYEVIPGIGTVPISNWEIILVIGTVTISN